MFLKTVHCVWLEVASIFLSLVFEKNNANGKEAPRQVKAWVERLNRPPTEIAKILFNDAEGSK